MLKLGKLRKDTCSTVIDVFEFDMKSLSWNQVPKVVEFIEDKKCLGSGGFRTAYKATSNHPAFLGSTWVVKRYLTDAKACISETGQTLEEHNMKAVQMHLLARNFALQL